MELYDILTLDDNKDYCLVKLEEFKGETYCLLIEVDKEENPLDNVLVLKRIEVKENEFEFEEIDDSEELKEITEIFQEQMINEENEEEEDTEE